MIIDTRTVLIALSLHTFATPLWFNSGWNCELRAQVAWPRPLRTWKAGERPAGSEKDGLAAARHFRFATDKIWHD